MTVGAGPARYSVVCLDMAGTTVRDDGTVRSAFESALAAMGIRPGHEHYDRAVAFLLATMGRSKIEVFRELAGSAGLEPTAADRANVAFERSYASAIGRGEVEALPGAAEAIAAIRSSGMRVCLTTGFSAGTCEAVVSALGWGSLVDLALAPEDVGRGRPWPDLPLGALVRLGGGSVAELVVVGDTPSDMACGVRSGAGLVVGVLTGSSTAAELHAAGAMSVVEGVADVVPLLGVGVGVGVGVDVGVGAVPQRPDGRRHLPGPAVAEPAPDGDPVVELASRQRVGWSMEQALHLDPDVHAREIDRIWRRDWLFAGHGAELPLPGDQLVVDLGSDSLVLARTDSGEVRAWHNVCRHRGSRLLPPGRHHGRTVQCPYHQWAYGLDGRLLSCGGAGDEPRVEAGALGLVPVAAVEVGGLVFACLDPTPPPADFVPGFTEALAPQGLDRARVAFQRTWEVEAGWKLVWENNRECWHCRAGHPEYVRANFDVAPPGSPEVAARIAARTDDMRRSLAGLPAAEEFGDVGLAPFPSPGRTWSAHRTPLVEGWVTESLDGRPVAPLMGEYPTHDVGTLRLRMLPNFWCHASSDHVVTTRLVPLGPGRTEAQVTWLVADGAVEGRDYQLDQLVPVWLRTSEQDWELCERNQQGVSSSAYRPGPHVARWEANVTAFDRWCLDRLGGHPGGMPAGPG